MAREGDPAAARLLDAEGLHVDALLDFNWQRIAVGRQQASEHAREDVELFQIRVGERQQLGEEGV